MRPFHMHCAIAAAAIGCALPTVATATVYDVAADFSPSTNPNGAWSLGYSTTLGGAFTPHNINGTTSGLNYWWIAGGYPAAVHNPSASPISAGTGVFNPGQFTMHPGPGGEFAVARFTAQVSGLHSFSAAFVGVDNVFITTTDVHLLVNGTPAFSGLVTTFAGTPLSSGTFSMTLTAGDTIEAAVGFGTAPFSDFNGDTTGVALRIDAVPTPGAAALLGLGGLMASRRRR